jgi:RimJ/RimL family protein N-acetyltransferase
MTLDRQPVLSGTLVELRPLQEHDVPALQAIASDPQLWDQHPAKDRTSPVVFRRWMDDALASGGALTVIGRNEDRIIGSSRFDHFDRDRGEIEIGWTFIARAYWGGVYNGEIKRLMLGHAFASVGTVVFRIHSHNMRSQRAVEKLGAVRVGVEADAEGRGDNHAFRLERAAYLERFSGDRRSGPARGSSAVGR